MMLLYPRHSVYRNEIDAFCKTQEIEMYLHLYAIIPFGEQSY